MALQIQPTLSAIRAQVTLVTFVTLFLAIRQPSFFSRAEILKTGAFGLFLFSRRICAEKHVTSVTDVTEKFSKIMQPKYCVLKEHTIYLLGLTPPDFSTDYYPSCQWTGDDPLEGQKVADECNARLVRDKKASAVHVRAMRKARAARLGLQL